MNNFTFSIPTIVHFGKGQISHLTELRETGDRVLLVYGGGSIRKNGIYDAALSVLQQAGMRVYELGGVEPNPKVELVREGVTICKENEISSILAIGGGSSIDCAKLIAAGACSELDPWKLMENSALIEKALPIYVVLTLAATGSEMDDSTVISNRATKEKLDINAVCITPKMAVLDPEYTYSVPATQTAAGAVDIISHVFESYFHNVSATTIQDHLALSVIRTVVEYAPIAMKQPDNYDARANLMWCSSLALNGILTYGAGVKWCVHPIEHELSAIYDITHGVGLAIITPVWMEYILNETTKSRIATYGREVWNINTPDDMEAAQAAIAHTRQFFQSLGMPSTLTEIGIDDKNFHLMSSRAERFCHGSYVPLTSKDIYNIYKLAQ